MKFVTKIPQYGLMAYCCPWLKCKQNVYDCKQNVNMTSLTFYGGVDETT
ncbi:MAG: hypothetical protein JXB14_02175 [Candidatus Altiarchaeota archaeon]|nr:hypothetical protein [Candidatus Altiarchaeota archaeon]